MISDKQYMDRLQSVILLRQQGYYDAAKAVVEDLMTHRPEESSLWHQIGQIATAEGENPQLCVDAFGQSLRLLREHGSLSTHALAFQATSLGYGQSLMRVGRFSEAWPHWEAGRLHVSWSPWPLTEYWDGTTDCIPSLLVQAEGGYGDIFMFMRWIGFLKSVKGVGRIGLMIFPGLADFCDWSQAGVDEVYKTGIDKIPYGRWSHSSSVMSLPAIFDVQGWNDIPSASVRQYLDLPDRETADLTDPFLYKVGFCWRAEENSSPIKTKSLDLDTAAQVVRLIRLQFTDELVMCSLSPEKKDLYNSEHFEQPPGLAYEPGCMDTWRDTAKYLLSMDAVLTVDSAVGHLCGLLGVPALVLVPRGGCWRFGMQNETVSRWYGPHVSLYRQPKVLTWDAAQIAEAFMEKINVNADAADAAAL